LLIVNKPSYCSTEVAGGEKQNFIYVDFCESIAKICPEYEKNTVQYMDQCYTRVGYPMTNRQILNLAMDLYAKNNPVAKETVTNQKIPKIIHQIWLGSGLPERYRKFQKEWIKNNPDWEYKLWTDKDIAIFEEQNKEMFKGLKKYSYAFKSDVLRCEILYKFGGLYIDTDYEFVKHFDIFNDSYEFYCCMEPLCSHVVIANTVIGSIPGHPILKTYLDDLRENINKWNRMNVDDGARLLATTGPSYFTRCVVKTITEFGGSFCENVIILPPSYFYPPVRYGTPVKFPETYGIHYWDMSWTAAN
jgi:mannosyltransferase OCH1-like enzyme